MKDYQKMLDTLTNVPTGNGFVGDFSKYRESLLSLQELVDKEKPEKPIEEGCHFVCPNCKKAFVEKPERCPHCGQRLDWGEPKCSK